MTVGAHYLTDVAIAGLVTMLAYGVVLAASRFCLQRKNAKNNG